MKALIELVGLITRHKKKRIEVLGQDDDSTNRYDTFYNLIASGDLSTDDEAARYFFGDDKDGSFIQYRNLRNNLFRRLVNSAFFIDLKKPLFNDAQAAVQNVRKNAAAARIVGSRGASHSSLEIAEKTVKVAQDYELVYELIDLARLLRHKYAFIQPDKEKRTFYEKLINDSLSDLVFIAKAEKMYYELVEPYIRSRDNKPWVNKKAKQFLRELDSDKEQCTAHYFRVLYYSIAELESITRYDYEATVRICQEALSFLDARKATTPQMKAAFLQSIIASATMLQWYEEAEKAVEAIEGLNSPGTYNWYKGMEQTIYLRLHQKQYQKAYQVFEVAKKHRRYNHLPLSFQELWRILEAYLHLLHAMGRISVTTEGAKCFRLRPARFLNDIPIFSKDKRGMNIPVLIVHAIMLLHLKRYDEAYDRMLALNKYAGRHLSAGNDTIRSYCFIKALVCIHNANYEKEAAQSAAEDLLAQMSENPLQLVHAPHEIEVIPYEHLWEIAMESISR